MAKRTPRSFKTLESAQAEIERLYAGVQAVMPWMTNHLTLQMVYEECLRALNDRKETLEERRSYLCEIGQGESEATKYLDDLLLMNRHTEAEIRTLAAASASELDCLRFECARLKKLADASQGSTREDQTDG